MTSHGACPLTGTGVCQLRLLLLFVTTSILHPCNKLDGLLFNAQHRDRGQAKGRHRQTEHVEIFKK